MISRLEDFAAFVYVLVGVFMIAVCALDWRVTRAPKVRPIHVLVCLGGGYLVAAGLLILSGAV